MLDNPAEPATPLDYKGHQIVLLSHQQADGTWICEYFILESGRPQTESSTGHSDGTFPSREAAELAAVQKAKALIDLR